MLIFIDIETTGLEYNDKICAVAIINSETKEYLQELINDGKKIPPKASSIHHITNEMIKDKSSFKESKIYKYLQNNNELTNTLISHNITFILEKLSSSGFIWRGDVIDTLKVTKHLIPECELFSLQVLRYELKLYRDENSEKGKYGIKYALVAHDALSDALIISTLFKYLISLSTLDDMKRLSFENVLLQKFTFGKYKGKYIEEICMNDRAYIEWMLRSVTDIDEDMKYSLQHYIEG